MKVISMADNVKLTLPDGKVLEIERGTTVYEAAKKIGARLAEAVVAGKIDGKTYDLSHKIMHGGKFELLKPDTGEGLEIFRHSTAHIMAQAILRAFPGAKLTIGPVVEEGFYYDIDYPTPFTPEDFRKIEQEMSKIVVEEQPFERREISKEEALALYPDNPYKRELINGIADEKVSVYYNSDKFYDLCFGPHVSNTGKITAFKLMKVAGAYWRGDAKNPQLQRIYGISFPDAAKLKEYVSRLAEAQARDHRKVGRELGLLVMKEEAPGMPFLLPKGMIVRNELERFWRIEHTKAGYKEIKTPIIMNEELWHKSGHWDHYKENMYFTEIDELPYAVKPMNCPGAMLAYASDAHSYRELPLRLAELGLVHRHELAGVLSGMVRVRAFTQDDCHIFAMPEQVEQEVKNVMALVDKFYRIFGFEYDAYLATRPEKYIGTVAEWDKAESTLHSALKAIGKEYIVNKGDGAFYGPKIDIQLKDAIGRKWQCATIQVDLQMPGRFGLTYEGADGAKHTPAVVHRVIYGSIERFMAILIEHYAGAFPVWLAPVQVALLSISDQHNKYCYKLRDAMLNEGLRAEVNDRQETIGAKIRDAQMQKVPYMLVIGSKEEESGKLQVRNRKGRISEMSEKEFVAHVLKMIEEKRQIE